MILKLRDKFTQKLKDGEEKTLIDVKVIDINTIISNGKYVTTIVSLAQIDSKLLCKTVELDYLLKNYKLLK